jgi:hypothetical protein
MDRQIILFPFDTDKRLNCLNDSGFKAVMTAVIDKLSNGTDPEFSDSALYEHYENLLKDCKLYITEK